MKRIGYEKRSKQLALRTTEEVAQQLKDLAEHNEVTVSTMAEYIIKEYLERERVNHD